MMVGMAAGVVEMVPPAEQAEQMQEQPVQPFRAEHRAVTEFVRSRTREEAAHGTVGEQCDREAQPGGLRPEMVGQPAGSYEEREMSAGLKPSLQVASFGELSPPRAIYGTSIPLDAKVLTYLSQRLPVGFYSNLL